MKTEITFPFKGTRNYVHGTSIFDAIVKAAQDADAPQGKIDISFKQMATNPCCVIEQRLPQPDDYTVATIYSNESNSRKFCMTQNAKFEPAKYQEYDEHKICANAIISNQSIFLDDHPDSSDIETIVALCKRLHLNIFKEKKWVFSRYSGKYPLNLDGKTEIRIKNAIGTKLTCSEIYSEDNRIGEIYFS